jgi:hypothetical protein
MDGWIPWTDFIRLDVQQLLNTSYGRSFIKALWDLPEQN